MKAKKDAGNILSRIARNIGAKLVMNRIQNPLCKMGFHIKGNYMGVGRVIVTEKKNKALPILAGRWHVYKCRCCEDPYSNFSLRTSL